MHFLFAAIFIALNTPVDSAVSMTKKTMEDFCKHFAKSDLKSILSVATLSTCLDKDPPCEFGCEKIPVPGTDFCLETMLVDEAEDLGYKFENLRITEDEINKRSTGKCFSMSKDDCEKDDECESCTFIGKDICGSKKDKLCSAASNLETRTEDIMKAATVEDVIKILDSGAKSGSRNGVTGTAAAMVALLILSIIAVL